MMGPVTARQLQGTLVSLGYQGRDATELIDQLLQADVSTLVDVRLTPLSRKPGLSKRRLADALNAAGIQYVHLPHLGNPKDNRETFRGGKPDSRARYLRLLQSPDGRAAMRHIAEMLDGGVVALLCFERVHTTCHRALVAAELGQSTPGLRVWEL